MLKTKRESTWTIGDDASADVIVVTGGKTAGLVTIQRGDKGLHISVEAAGEVAKALVEASRIANQ